MTIELTQAEALMLRALSEAGAYDIRNGSVTIHFDERSNVRMIEISTQTRYPQVGKIMA